MQTKTKIKNGKYSSELKQLNNKTCNLCSLEKKNSKN